MMKWHFGQKWGDLMSRRRSTNPTKAISITLPMTILDDIDDNLTRLQSRSAWIAEACRGRLEDHGTVDLTTRQLMAMLHARIDDETLKTVLLDRLTS
jgi:metal-responsive CopG/Arc/MetJ family transcriptional regulator